MSHHNDLPSRFFPPHAYDAALAARLPGARQPGGIAIMWRVWLTYSQANALLAELRQLQLPLSVMGVIDERWMWLYLWQHRLLPDLEPLLLTYDPSAMPVDPQQIDGRPAWACGRALVRLVAARTQEAHPWRS